jgi:hypothetical protein
LVRIFTETDIIKMIEILIDNIFVLFGGGVFQDIGHIHMGTNSSRRFLPLFVRGMRDNHISDLHYTFF